MKDTPVERLLRLAAFAGVGALTAVAAALLSTRIDPLSNVPGHELLHRCTGGFVEQGDDQLTVHVSRWDALGGVFLHIRATPRKFAPSVHIEPGWVVCHPVSLIPMWCRASALHPPGDGWPTRRPYVSQEREFEGRGCPWTALWLEYTPQGSAVRAEGGWLLGSAAQSRPGAFTAYPAAVPCRIAWLGLAADSALYGLGWWAATHGALLLQKRRRRQRDECAGCGYSREGLVADARCPECGLAPDPVAPCGMRGSRPVLAPLEGPSAALEC